MLVYGCGFWRGERWPHIMEIRLEHASRRVCDIINLDRDMAQCMSGALPMSLPSARAVLNPAGCRIFKELSCFSPLKLGTLSRCWVLGQCTSPSNASLDSGEDEYLVGQRWQCVGYDKFSAPKRLQYCLLSVDLKWYTTEQVQWYGGNMSADKSLNLISDYRPLTLPLFLWNITR